MGPDGATQPTGTRPESEAITTLSLADLKAALLGALPGAAWYFAGHHRARRHAPAQAAAGQLQRRPGPSKPRRSRPRRSQGGEAIEAIDAREASTLVGLGAKTAEAPETVEDAIEAKTAQAMQAIEAMTVEALDAIDATVAEIGTGTGEATGSEITQILSGQPDTGQPDTGQPDTGQPGPADTAPPGTTMPGAADNARPNCAVSATPSPGAEVATTRIIRLDEPPASVTLTTPATETTIALPQPRSESIVAVMPVTPVAAAADTATVTPVPQRGGPGGPAALPPARPGPPAEAHGRSPTPSRPMSPPVDARGSAGPCCWPSCACRRCCRCGCTTRPSKTRPCTSTPATWS